MTADLARKRRVRATIVAALIALVAIPVGIAGPVAAAPGSSSPVDKYVALGDSVAAGQGGGSYLDACLRSPAGYPALLDAQPKLNLLRNAACTGATITDVTANQLSQVNRGTTLVTVTVGANGVDLQGLYAACASGQTPVACAEAVNDAANYLNSGEVPAQLGALIAGIDARSPRATIVVTGYPVPFAPGLSPVADNVNQLVELLNTQLALTALTAAPADAEVVWAPVEFGAHRVGGAPPAYLGANPGDPVTFLHPTPDGYVVYRDAVLAAMG
ncbi:lysophospholipase L1-like esterase [Agromyces cerinus]|uniref:SGNH/GDSL hydrolase family protein n=1 Tax=Agromyces cerinus TaxID=33878 RepID=UPI0019572D35|nr:SGNH/GDSL hydrolase family protein [Agromyces cerinus]MBM7831656.1 lysophospholipase L1-like esterase [Agromyces cerinus]